MRDIHFVVENEVTGKCASGKELDGFSRKAIVTLAQILTREE